MSNEGSKDRPFRCCILGKRYILSWRIIGQKQPAGIRLGPELSVYPCSGGFKGNHYSLLVTFPWAARTHWPQEEHWELGLKDPANKSTFSVAGVMRKCVSMIKPINKHSKPTIKENILLSGSNLERFIKKKKVLYVCLDWLNILKCSWQPKNKF